MTHLSSQDKAIYTKVFKKVDADGDGFLDRIEVHNLCVALGYKLTPEQMDEMFTTLDKDKNNKVTLEEFLLAMDPIDKVERQCAHLRRLFHSIDKNKDGFLSADELQGTLNDAMKECGVTLSKSQVQDLITKVDVNGDGKMNYEEFLTLLAALGIA